jgi:hypothetical protein
MMDEYSNKLLETWILSLIGWVIYGKSLDLSKSQFSYPLIEDNNLNLPEKTANEIICDSINIKH